MMHQKCNNAPVNAMMLQKCNNAQRNAIMHQKCNNALRNAIVHQKCNNALRNAPGTNGTMLHSQTHFKDASAVIDTSLCHLCSIHILITFRTY